MAKFLDLLGAIAGDIENLSFRNRKGTAFVGKKQSHAITYTTPQLLIRRSWANKVSGYRACMEALEKNFPNKPAKQTTFNAFISANAESTKVFLTKSEVRARGCVVAPFVVSEGQLRSVAVQKVGDNYCSNISLGDLVIDGTTTIESLSAAIVSKNKDYDYGDKITFMALYQSVDAKGIPHADMLACYLSLDKSNAAKVHDKFSSSYMATVNGCLGITSVPAGFTWIHSRTYKLGDAEYRQVSSQTLTVENPLLASYTSEEAFEAACTSYGGVKDYVTAADGTSGTVGYEPTPETRYTQTVSVAEGMEAMGSVSGGGSYAEGTEITIHAVANSGYTFKGWKLNGGSTYESTEADYTYEVEADNTFVAEFQAEAAQVTLTVGQDTNPNWGDIQIDDRTAAKTDTITVAAGTEVTIKAIAATGYSFSSWTDGNTSATRTITVTENKTVNASFESR